MLGISDEYINLANTCIEVLKINKYEAYDLDIELDNDLIYKTFLYDIEFDESDQNSWIDLMKQTELGHLSFLLNNTATLKSIYNISNEDQKKAILYYFIRLCNKIKIFEKFTSLRTKITNNIQIKEDVEDVVLELISDFKKYKKPKYFAKIIDTWTNNKDFRDYVIKQVKSKTSEMQHKITETGLFTNEDTSIIKENIEDFDIDKLLNIGDYIKVLKDFFDYIMKINITGEIRVSRELHLYVSNYVIDLFKESSTLLKVVNVIDEEYKKYESQDDKDFIVRYNVSTVKQNGFKKKDHIERGFYGIIETDKKVIYTSKELKKRVIHIILKLVEIGQFSFMGNTFEDFNKEEEIKKIFKNISGIDKNNLSFSSVLDIIVSNEIDNVVDRENLKSLITNVFDKVLCKEKNEVLLALILRKINEFMDFFKDKTLETKAINIAKRICTFLDKNVNWANIKKTVENRKKISFKRY